MQTLEQSPLQENVATCVHFAHKWNTHYAWSKYIQRGREWEEKRKDDASAVFHLLKGQQQRKLLPAAPCPLMSSAFSLYNGIYEEEKTKSSFAL